MPVAQQIIEENSDAIWRTIYRLVNNRDDALECFQETLLAALRLSEQKQVRHWRTYLLRIAAGKAMDRLRARYRDQQLTTHLAEQTREGVRIEPPDARAIGDELREQVRQALVTLPAQQAEAFWLRHVEQLGPTEVAEALGVESGHARVLVHRAAEHLRTLLMPIYGPQTPRI